jgi:TPR repeat protein
MRFAILVAAVLAAAPAMAQQPTRCDQLAGHVEDPDKVGPGVADVADNKAAIAACEKDLAADPNNRRLKYQLARVLFYDGQTAKAVELLEAAANAGSSQAQFVLGYITDEGLQGVRKDFCKVEVLWLKSARQGRFAALVSYPHHVLNGLFPGCTVQASDDEMTAFLAKARKDARAFGYYAEVLAMQLAKDFAAYRVAKK